MTSPDLIGKQLRRAGTEVAVFWAQHLHRIKKPFLRSPLLAGTVACLAPIIVTLLFFFSPSGTGMLSDDSLQEEFYQTEKRLEIRLPDLRSQMEAIGKKDDSVMRETYVTGSDTFSSLLAKLGVRDSAVLSFVESTPQAREFLFPKIGQYVTASTLENGSLISLRLYEETRDNHTVLEINRDAAKLNFSKKPFRYDIQLTMADGIVHGLPSLSLQKSNIPAPIIAQMHEAFDYDRDVVNNLSQGETFRIIYESKYIGGNFVRLGKLLAMQFEFSGKTRDFFWFPDDGQGGHYYDSKGVLTRRTYMRVPLDVKNVSSEFSPMRRHPITGVLRPHRGTDFRAPWGATVRAAADGKVVFAGLGSGYGKYIRIQHGPDYQTLYAHLSSISPNIRVGSEVRNGEQIGKVGQTGLATGPHLHYELIFNGTQINPMTADLPDTKTLSPYRLARMEALISPLQEKLSLLRRVQVSGVKK